MQAVAQKNLLFIRSSERNYMMRSEKRQIYRSKPSGGPGRKRPRKRAGAWYVLLALLLCIVIWPLGMIMLWKRRVRASVGAKLLASLITLALCVSMYAALLHAPTENSTLKNIQEATLSALDKGYSGTLKLIDALLDRYDGSTDVINTFRRAVVARTADEIESMVKRTENSRAAVLALTSSIRQRGVDMLQDVGVLPSSEPTPSLTPTPTAAPTPTLAPTAAPTPVTLPEMPIVRDVLQSEDIPVNTPTPRPSIAPAAPGMSAPRATARPDVPTATVAPEHTVTSNETFTAVEIPTPAPTIITPSVTLKPAGSATVYHTTNGTYYHTASSCTGMQGAKAYTLSSSVRGGLKQCPRCNPPAAELLDEYAMWVDDGGMCHTSNECNSFSGTYTLISRTDAIASKLEACTSCFAGEYLIPNSVIAE